MEERQTRRDVTVGINLPYEPRSAWPRACNLAGMNLACDVACLFRAHTCLPPHSLPHVSCCFLPTSTSATSPPQAFGRGSHAPAGPTATTTAGVSLPLLTHATGVPPASYACHCGRPRGLEAMPHPQHCAAKHPSGLLLFTRHRAHPSSALTLHTYLCGGGVGSSGQAEGAWRSAGLPLLPVARSLQQAAAMTTTATWRAASHLGVTTILQQAWR